VKLKNEIRRGIPVDPPPGAATAHAHITPGGRRVVIARDARGKILPGARMCDLRAPGDVGVEARRPESVALNALGLQTPVTEWRARKREEGGR